MKSRERAVSPLLEMIISILILAFAGVVSVSIFLSARYTQIMSFDKTNAMYKVQNVIEMTKADKIPENPMYFDKNWQECDEKKAIFALSITTDEKENLIFAKAECHRIEKYPFIKEGSEKLCRIDFTVRASR